MGLKVQDKGSPDDPDFCGEAFDFILENWNRKIKAMLDWAPSKTDWLISCRTLGLIQNLLNNFYKDFKLARYEI